MYLRASVILLLSGIAFGINEVVGQDYFAEKLGENYGKTKI